MFTKENITKKVVKEETRKIKFRDDNYSIDSKSRFEVITEEINLDVDEFIEAINDAIAAASQKTSATVTSTKKPEPKPTEEDLDDLESAEEPEVEKLEPVLDDIEEDDEEEDIFNDVEEEEEEEEISLEELVKETQTKYKAMTDKDKKKEVQAFIKASGGLNAMTADQINEALSMM